MTTGVAGGVPAPAAFPETLAAAAAAYVTGEAPTTELPAISSCSSLIKCSFGCTPRDPFITKPFCHMALLVFKNYPLALLPDETDLAFGILARRKNKYLRFRTRPLRRKFRADSEKGPKKPCGSGKFKILEGLLQI
jgi:hypothetical protein